jgi:peptidoglycan/xylan/chitin deacetylase (PgdA/CDA1 family)
MNDVLILCYHAVSERWPASLSVTPERLEGQLECLVRAGYRPVTFTRAVTDPPAGKTLAVTFDDGFRSVVRLAHPVMKRLGVPGTVFVATGHVGTEQPMAWSGLEHWLGTEYERELVAASWPELNALRQDGWEIGAHTRQHPHLTQLDEASIYEELAGSRSDVEEHIGGPCTSLAYPYGDHDARVVAGADRAGFLRAATLPSHWQRPEPLRWPRVYVAHRDRTLRFRLKVSRPVRMTRAATRIAADSVSGRLGRVRTGRAGPS